MKRQGRPAYKLNIEECFYYHRKMWKFIALYVKTVLIPQAKEGIHSEVTVDDVKEKFIGRLRKKYWTEEDITFVRNASRCFLCLFVNNAYDFSLDHTHCSFEECLLCPCQNEEMYVGPISEYIARSNCACTNEGNLYFNFGRCLISGRYEQAYIYAEKFSKVPLKFSNKVCEQLKTNLLLDIALHEIMWNWIADNLDVLNIDQFESKYNIKSSGTIISFLKMKFCKTYFPENMEDFLHNESHCFACVYNYNNGQAPTDYCDFCPFDWGADDEGNKKLCTDEGTPYNDAVETLSPVDARKTADLKINECVLREYLLKIERREKEKKK